MFGFGWGGFQQPWDLQGVLNATAQELSKGNAFHDINVCEIPFLESLIWTVLITYMMEVQIVKHSPLLSGPVRAVSLLVYSSAQELLLLPWTQTPPVSHSALCSSGVPLPTSQLTSAGAVGPGVPVRTEEHWILQREIRFSQTNLKARWEPCALSQLLHLPRGLF